MAKSMVLVFISGETDQYMKAGTVKIEKKGTASLLLVIIRSLRESGRRAKEKGEEC